MSDDAARFARIEALFHDARAQPPARREAFLRASTDDPALRDEVMRLLAHDDDDNPLAPRLRAVLDDPATERLDRAQREATASMPERIGRYRLIRELGSGGMARVFLAERDIDGRAQNVALKRMAGGSTASLRRKALRERALLAGLNHRGIAGLIDAGETDDGTPYLVMEYIDGMALDRFVRAGAIGLRERLRLFRDICDAIEHAHQRLILHLDLKPANVLVRGDGTIALIDFGIGHDLDDEDAGLTRTAAYTPLYAAPEQRAGERPTTATDVYGAGLLLLELLSDEGFAALRRRSPGLAIETALQDPAIERAVPADLRRVVAFATRAAPEDRYASIADLRTDIEHFLAGRMLRASRQRWWVRAGKFCRRNAWPLASGLAVLALTAAFVVRLSIERERALDAEKNASIAQDLQASVLFALTPGDNAQARSEVQRLLDRERARWRDGRDCGDCRAQDPGWRSIASVTTVAEIYASIGDPEPALKSADEALRMLERRRREERDVDPDLYARALTARAGALSQLERYSEAAVAYARMVAAREAQPGIDRDTLMRAHLLAAEGASMRGDYEDAEAALHRADAVAADPRTGRGRIDDATRVEAAIAHLDAAARPDAIEQARERFNEMETLAARTLPPDAPLWTRVRLASSRHRQNIGDVKGALADAQDAYRRTRAAYGERSNEIAVVDNNIGTMLADLGRYREALTHFDRARAVQTSLSANKRFVLALNDANRASAHYNLGEYADAARAADAAIRALPGNEPAHRRVRNIARSNLARARSELGDHRAALAAARALTDDDAFRALPPLERAFGEISLFRVWLAAGDLDRAQKTLDETTPVLVAQMPAGHPIFAYTGRRRGLLAAARGRWDEADREFGRALAAMTDDPLARAETEAAQANAALRLGDAERARTLLRRALPVLRRDTADDNRETLEAERLWRELDAGTD